MCLLYRSNNRKQTNKLNRKKQTNTGNDNVHNVHLLTPNKVTNETVLQEQAQITQEQNQRKDIEIYVCIKQI